jgi:hypothetical protein
MTCSPKTDPHFKLEWWIEGRQGDEKEAVYTLGENPPLKLSITAIYPHLWVLPKCFDNLSICALCRPAPPLSFDFRFPHACGGEVSTVIAPRAQA